MAHSKTKIWLHVVFSTKNRLPLLTPALRQRTYELLKTELIQLGCYVDCINGVEDHIHLLFAMTPRLPVQEVIKQIKGSTSHTINQKQWSPERFAWQTGYGAFSVSQGHIARVRNYIARQEEHHQAQTFTDEYARFMRHYELELTDADK